MSNKPFIIVTRKPGPVHVELTFADPDAANTFAVTLDYLNGRAERSELGVATLHALDQIDFLSERIRQVTNE